MRTIVIFYSRTGNTRKIAHAIAEKLKCPSEEIFDTKDRRGIRGYLSAGRDATLRKLTQIKPIAHDPANYDIIIIGTPIWAWTISTPIRTYLEQNKKAFKKIAFFCTMGGSGSERAFAEMKKICANKPLATLALTAKEAIKNKFEEKIIKFALSINY
jgi:flavodoxin